MQKSWTFKSFIQTLARLLLLPELITLKMVPRQRIHRLIVSTIIPILFLMVSMLPECFLKLCRTFPIFTIIFATNSNGTGTLNLDCGAVGLQIVVALTQDYVM